MTENEIHFISNRRPDLLDGEYTLNLALDISSKGEIIERMYSFSVSGQRFTLKPADIQSIFPPAGSMGDHSDVLPHIILNRSTLPWERLADPENKDAPWLALLLFDEQETPTPEVITLDEVWKQGLYSPEPGKDSRDSEKEGQDRVTVIGVNADFLPTSDELALLAHVRIAADAEVAVVIGNRLPKQGRMSTVHLVSMEGYYKGNESDISHAGLSDKVRLISLYSWHFACLDRQQNFTNLLSNLSPHTLRLENPVKEQTAEKYLAMGCAPLLHTLRKGDTTISWYHGPLVPGENTTLSASTPNLPVLCSDQLVRYNRETMMFDVSYAAAWELGRLLALQSKTFSTDLYIWKRSNAQNLKEAERHLTGLPFDSPDPSLGFPPAVQAWFERLENLEGIPFNYLVPDEHMLPQESICFFFVDWLWLECMRDGAFSIGRVMKSDDRWDSTQSLVHMSRPSRRITGFLLRSEAVSGWPGLLVDGSDKDNNPLTLLRMDRLSKNILLCLFEGEVNMVDFHLKLETLHFKPSNSYDNGKIQVSDGILHKDSESKFTSADFAKEAIEAAEKIRLIK